MNSHSDAGIRTTLVELLRDRSAVHPDRLAFTFLIDGENQESNLTYAGLDQRARAIASYIKTLCLPGDRALLVLPQGLDFVAAFYGCLYAGVIAVPMDPLNFADIHISTARMKRIVRDCRPALAFTTSESLCAIGGSLLRDSDLKDVHWVTTENINGSYSDKWDCPPISGESLALLQYTSGSTSEPKGVMISHMNLLWPRTASSSSGADSTRLTWMPLAHSLALTSGVIRTLYAGSRSILMSPENFLQDPLRWLRAISRYGVQFSGGPCFAYELCVSRFTAEACKELDLSKWKVATVSAERANLQALRQFASIFSSYGFDDHAFTTTYGLTEMQPGPVSQSPIGRGLRVLRLDNVALQHNDVLVDPSEGVLAADLVSSGKPQAVEITIVDPETNNPNPSHRIGEIWISGNVPVRGYWNRPAESEYTFRALLREAGEDRFLRTGDLGFIHHGELIITGRIKDLIVVRGRNIYPQDIEFTAQNCRSDLPFGDTLAFSIESPTGERVVIVQELRIHRALDFSSVTQLIRRSVLAEHGVVVYAVVFVKAGSVPKTSGGKVRRQSCREAYLAGKLDVITENILDCEIGYGRQYHDGEFLPPRTATERSLREIWCAVLNLQNVGIDDNFLDLGGQSILAAQCLNRIRATFAVDLPVTLMFAEKASIRHLAMMIDQLRGVPT